GFGTTVKLYFPAMGEDEPRDTYQEGFSDPAERNDRLSEVLVVEDEEDVRKIIVSQLRSAGLKVMDVASGDIAVTLLDSGYRPKLILSDVILSGKIQGPELGRIAHEKVRDLKVVFLSGYPNEAATMSSHMLDTDVQLIKPVRKDKLIRTVKRALEELEDS
ncbi:MAG: response regulator, partial [Pseudomonadota bacterium]